MEFEEIDELEEGLRYRGEAIGKLRDSRCMSVEVDMERQMRGVRRDGVSIAVLRRLRRAAH